jgi:hypothetical protein
LSQKEWKEKQEFSNVALDTGLMLTLVIIVNQVHRVVVNDRLEYSIHDVGVECSRVDKVRPWRHKRRLREEICIIWGLPDISSSSDKSGVTTGRNFQT